jgi:hypothetical protein
MSLYDKITKIVDEELEHRINTILNDYAEILSKKHGIALDVLLKDLPDTYTSTTCKGTKSNGHRCAFKGVFSGYCRHHKVQGERICHRIPSSASLHNHGPEQMFVRGCPGCETSNELIDLNTIL